METEHASRKNLSPDKPYAPIILIAGTAGTGKSPFSRKVYCQMSLDNTSDVKIDHVVDSGSLRAAVRKVTDNPVLATQTFGKPHAVRHVKEQSKALRPAVKAIIDRSREQGVGVIIEGSNLLPKHYRKLRKEIDVFIVLRAPGKKEHRKRVEGPSHTNRDMTGPMFHRIRKIDSLYKKQSKKNADWVKTLVFTSDQDITNVVDTIQQLGDRIHHGKKK